MTSLRRLFLSALVLALPALAAAQTYTIAPSPFQTALDNSGRVINNACIWTYSAGTTTPATTYATSTGTANSDPIRSDSAGRFTAYLQPGISYKFVYESACTPPAHGTTLRTADNIAATPTSASTVDVTTAVAGEAISAGQCAYLSDGSGGKNPAQWYKCDSANLYSSTLNDIGIAPLAISSGATGTIRRAGSVSGMSSLSGGTVYYVGSAGAITASAPTNARKIGQADSATTFIVGDAPLPTAGTGITIASGTIALTPLATVTTTSTGAQNDFATGCTFLAGLTCTLRANNATILTLTGIAGGVDGAFLRIVSIGAGQVDLVPQLAGTASVAANRLINFATVGATSLAAGAGAATFGYDGTTARWRLVDHDQGAWITPAFAAGSFGGSGGATWTVTSGETTTYAYYLNGRKLSVAFEVLSSTVGTGTTLTVAIPPAGIVPYVAAKQMSTTIGRTVDNGTAANGYMFVSAAGTVINLRREDGASWANATTASDLRGQIDLEVQ